MRDVVEQHGGEVIDEAYLPLEAGKTELREVQTSAWTAPRTAP